MPPKKRTATKKPSAGQPPELSLPGMLGGRDPAAVEPLSRPRVPADDPKAEVACFDRFTRPRHATYQDWFDDFTYRAAVYEYDAGIVRVDAEARARADVGDPPRDTTGRCQPPKPNKPSR